MPFAPRHAASNDAFALHDGLHSQVSVMTLWHEGAAI
jgi:hypothetical protein